MNLLKTILISLAFIFSQSIFAQMLESVDLLKTTKLLEPVDALFIKHIHKKHDIAGRTKDALLSYPQIEERANYLAKKLERLTVGNYIDELGYIAPLITGQINARVSDFDIFLNLNEGIGKLQYSIKF